MAMLEWVRTDGGWQCLTTTAKCWWTLQMIWFRLFGMQVSFPKSTNHSECINIWDIQVKLLIPDWHFDLVQDKQAVCQKLSRVYLSSLVGNGVKQSVPAPRICGLDQLHNPFNGQDRVSQILHVQKPICVISSGINISLTD
jgi:hypothetical protein